MNYNKFIDSTILKPNASESEIIALCNEAREYNFKSVCIITSYQCIA